MRKLALPGAAVAVIATLAVIALRPDFNDRSRAVSNLENLSEQSPPFRAVKLKALAGSIEAANSMMDYYSKCHVRQNLSPDLTPDKFKKCAAQVRYWTTVALENGSLSAAQRHANSLLESGQCVDIHRAEFWFGRFQEEFRSDRVFLKSVADQIAEKKQSCRW